MRRLRSAIRPAPDAPGTPRPEPAAPDERLAQASGWLYANAPQLSAFRVLHRRQAATMAVVATGGVGLALLAPRPLLVVAIGALTVIYLATLGLRLALFSRSSRGPAAMVVTDDEARAVPEDRLPSYTVLIPAFREPTMIPRILESLRRLDYPRNRLEVKLLLESDDRETVAAARAGNPPPEVEVVLVPAGSPRTKPKALNYGLLGSGGDLVTVYDVEDIPDPLQLRRAAVALERAPDQLACLQARLDYFNPEQNIITRWFTLEYALWFDHFLPGLTLGGRPVPLGGTSNHFRRDVLLRVGGWDPHNVTEDADLGLRLARFGYRVGMLASTTLEEANSDFVNWTKQRSRWYKGYLQTWLVHLRRPRSTIAAFGYRGFAAFNLFVGGTPILALINPVLWLLTTVWFLARPPIIGSIFPFPLLHLGLLSWLIGNFLVVYSFVIIAAKRGGSGLLRAALASPLYLLMMSVAAYKALIQLIGSPSFWEKTHHGLSSNATVESPGVSPVKL